MRSFRRSSPRLLVCSCYQSSTRSSGGLPLLWDRSCSRQVYMASTSTERSRGTGSTRQWRASTRIATCPPSRPRRQAALLRHSCGAFSHSSHAIPARHPHAATPGERAVRMAVSDCCDNHTRHAHTACDGTLGRNEVLSIIRRYVCCTVNTEEVVLWYSTR